MKLFAHGTDNFSPDGQPDQAGRDYGVSRSFSSNIAVRFRALFGYAGQPPENPGDGRTKEACFDPIGGRDAARIWSRKRSRQKLFGCLTAGMTPASGNSPPPSASPLPRSTTTESRSEIVEAAVELVWIEILTNVAEDVGSTFEADPEEVLVAVGLHTRQAFILTTRSLVRDGHSPRKEPSGPAASPLFANAFEARGYRQAAGDPSTIGGSYCFGTALYAASRLNAQGRQDPTDPTTANWKPCARKPG